MSVPKEGSREIEQGIIVAVPHDWCDSPEAPIPYKVWAKQIDATNLANSVRQTDCRSHVRGSVVRQCYGDQPGQGGGVLSGTFEAECTPKTWSATIRAEGRNMVRHTDEWWMNHKNTWGTLAYVVDPKTYPEASNTDRDLEKFEALDTRTYDPKTGQTKQTYDPRSKSNQIEIGPRSPEGVIGGPLGDVYHKLIDDGRDSLRISQRFRDRLCQWVCECLKDRGSSRTYQGCVAQKIRKAYYSHARSNPVFGNLRPYGLDGPIPEANWLKTGPNNYQLVMSQTETQMPSNRPVVAGAPRPDISYFNDGHLEKIYEMKFPNDTETQMQSSGEHENILQSQGRDPTKDLVKINVEDCACYKAGSSNSGGK